MRTLKITTCFILLFSLHSAGQKDTLTYVFFGHPYNWDNSTTLDPRVENIDTSEFDGIWLGGDVIRETSLYYSNFQYLDSLFNLQKPSNHWALGNHDTRNRNLEWYSEFTGRPTYYAHSTTGLTSIVMDGNITPLDCANLNKQFQMIQNVCDTISNGYLIFLIHHGITLDVPGTDQPSSYGHTALKHWMANCYEDSSSYLKSIYPMLIEVEKRGVEVMHIMGDVGASKKSYYGVSDDGIQYFGSGINNTYYTSDNLPIITPDLVLILEHIPKENKMNWKFVELNSLKTN